MRYLIWYPDILLLDPWSIIVKFFSLVLHKVWCCSSQKEEGDLRLYLFEEFLKGQTLEGMSTGKGIPLSGTKFETLWFQRVGIPRICWSFSRSSTRYQTSWCGLIWLCRTMRWWWIWVVLSVLLSTRQAQSIPLVLYRLVRGVGVFFVGLQLCLGTCMPRYPLTSTYLIHTTLNLAGTIYFYLQ